MNLRRLSVALAVGALLLASLGAGSVAAFAAPFPPSVDQTFADPWFTSDTQPAVQGNTDAGNAIIHVESSTDGVNFVPYCDINNSPPATVWFCPSPSGTLPVGTNQIRAIGDDGVGNLSTPGAPIDIHVVNAPTVTSPANDLYTNDATPTFAGASDGSTIHVTSTDFATDFCTGTVVGLNWNCTPLNSVPDGDYTYFVSTRFGASTTDIYSSSRTLHIDTIAPAAPSIDAISNPVNSSPGPTISGLAEENATIAVLVDGAEVPCPTGPIGYTGYWSCTIGATLSAGTHSVTAFQTDLAGNISLESGSQSLVITDNTPPNPPVITSPIGTVITNSTGATITGTGEPGASLDMFGNLCMVWPTIVDSSGNWTCQLSTPMSDGNHAVFFGQTDTALNASALAPAVNFTVDTVAPAAPTIDPPANPVNSSPGPTLSGMAEDNANIVVFVDGIATACPVGAIISGTWSCTIGPTLSSGSYSVMARQSDLAGNLSPLSAAQTLVITDNTPPVPPVILTPAGSLVAGVLTAYTNHPYPFITGTGEPFTNVEVDVDAYQDSCQSANSVQSDGTWQCVLDTPLADGPHDVKFYLTDAANNDSAYTVVPYSLIVDTVAPDSPTVTSPTGPSVDGIMQVTTTNLKPLITGTAEDGATVQIFRDGSIPVPCASNPLIAGSTGFSCQVSSPLPYGTHDYSFVQTDLAGNTSGSALTLLEITIPNPPPVPSPPTATLPTLGLSWFLKFTSSSYDPQPGQHVTLSGSNLPVGAVVTAELHSTPVPLGTSVVQADGTFILNTVIPNTVQPGTHHYVVTVTPAEGAAQTSQLPVTILTLPTPNIGLESTSPVRARGVSPGGTGHFANPRNAPGAPNSLSGSLTTLSDIISNPLLLAASALSSLALLFLVAFPAEILNSTLDENYERIFGKLPKIRVHWFFKLRDRLTRTPLAGGLALTTIAALILSFADPGFGFDLASLRLFLACAIGMFVLGYVANIVTGLILRRRWSIASVIELQPFGLLVALAGVVLSRVLNFAPGLLIGLVLGLSLSAGASAKEESRAVLVWCGVTLGLSVTCWVVYSLMSGGNEPGTFGGALLDDSIVAIATEGISGLVIGLLPIGFLDGRSVYTHSKWQWLAVYCSVLIAFFAIVVPSGALWGGIDGSFWVWLAVLIAFAIVCFGTYLWFRTHPEAEKVGDDSDRESADKVTA